MTETARVPIDSIHQDPRNARLHNDRNLEAIQRALARFGQQKPVVVGRENRIIYAGNGTHRAAQALGWTEIWVAWSDLTPDEAAAYAVADNRTAELAQWDDAQLMALANELDDATLLDAMGFDEGEMDALLSGAMASADALLFPHPNQPEERQEREGIEAPEGDGKGGIPVTLVIEVPRSTWKRFNELKKQLKTRDGAVALLHLLENHAHV